MRDEDRHPPEPWAFVERGITLDRLAQSESLFALEETTAVFRPAARAASTNLTEPG